MCSSVDAEFEGLDLGKDLYFKTCGPTLNDPIFNDNYDLDGDILMKQEPNILPTESQFQDSYIPDFNENLFSNFCMDDLKDFSLNVLEEATSPVENSEINPGSPNCNVDLQFPFTAPSPDYGIGLSDSTDAVSEVSSTSDLGSMVSGDSSPERLHQQELMDFSPTHSLSKNTHSTDSTKELFTTPNVITAGPNKTKIKLETVHAKGPAIRPATKSFTPATSSNSGQTIVLTQAGKQPQVLRSGALIKTINKGSSVFFPLQVVKDLGQGKTFKLISAPNGSNNQLKNGIRTLTVRTTPQTNGSRPILNKSVDGRPILKVGPTLVGNTQHKVVTPTVTVKDEPIGCDEDDSPKNGQRLELNEEEKRLLKKEHITLPSCYPLTKHQERDLKRIRRKIRNKISAQESRKRKKDQLEKLEYKIKTCSEDNQKLQKRIRYLQGENETLAANLQKYKQMVEEAGVPVKTHGQTSTALMILILSAALVIVPNLRPKDVMEGDLTPGDEPLPGKNRNLLGSAISLVKKELNLDKLKNLNLDEKDFNPLSEHDYAPLAKRPRLSSSSATPFHEFIPKVEKVVSGKSTEPPDPKGDSVSALLGAVLDTLNRNWNESRQEQPVLSPMDIGTQSLVVNLHSGKMIDDIELE